MNKKDFEERARLFRRYVEKDERKYGVYITVGYLCSWDDEEIIICDNNSNQKVYYEEKLK